MKGLRRISYIDSAKGVCMLLVIMGHSVYGGGLSSITLGFYMPLFFFVSGITSSNKDVSFGSFCKKKIKTLLVPYVIYMFFLYAIYTIRCILGEHMDLLDIKNFLVNILYSRYSLLPLGAQNNIQFLDMEQVCNAPMWFLTAFFVSSMIFYAFLRLQRAYKINWMWMVICCLLITYLLNNTRILLPWSFDTAFLGTAYMLTGYYCGPKIRDIIEQNRWRTFLAMSTLFLGLIFINKGTNMSVKNYGVQGNISIILFYGSGVLGSIICLYVCNLVRNFWICKKLEIIGRYSLHIMCLHLVILNVVGGFLVQLPVNHYVFQKVICFVVAIAICVFIIFIIKKILLAINSLSSLWKH